MNLIQLAAFLKESWTKIDSALSAGVVNAKAIEKAQTELAEMTKERDFLAAERDTLLTDAGKDLQNIAEKETELATAKARITELEKAKTSTALETQQLAASQGIAQDLTPSADSKTAAKKLTRAQFDALKHGERNEHIRSGGKVTE